MEGSTMNRNAIRKICLLALAILLTSTGTLYAGKKPKITRHDATLLQNAITITVEWQAEKPVVLLRATVGGESTEVELDEYDDNTRDRHGFYGEADVSITLEPYEAFVQKDHIPYVIQIRDDLGRKSEITGRVTVKVQEAEDTYREEGARYPGGMQGKPDDSGEYKTRHIIKDVLEIVKQHTARTRKGDSDDKPGQDPYSGAYPQGLFIQLEPGPDGEINVTVKMETQWQDPGAYVTDSSNNPIAQFDQIEKKVSKVNEQGFLIDVDEVDTREADTYQVAYNFQDSSGEFAQPKFRDVYVVDSAAPVIKLNGEDTITIFVGDEYQEYGAYVEDSNNNYIAEVDKKDIIVSKVDEQGDTVAKDDDVYTKEAAIYQVAYTFQYSSGKAAQPQFRNVHVVDSAAPVIILLPEGNTDVKLEVGTRYKEPKPGYKVMDKDLTTDITDKVTVEIDDSAVDTNTVGPYEVYYYIYDYDHGVYVTWEARNVYVEDSTTPDDEEGIKSPPPEGLGAFGKSQPPGTTKGPRKPPSVVRWKGMPHTGPATHVTPPKKLPPGITVAPQSNKKPRLYYKAKSPPTGSTVIKADSPKSLPDGITLAPGVSSQPATQPSDDKKKSDVKKMKPLR